MSMYEVIFRLQDPVLQQLEEQLLEKYDAFLGGHGDVYLLTISVDGGQSPRQSVLNAATQLFALGVVIERIEKDLVNASTIARRAGVSRAAVGNWIRGERQAHSTFPKPYGSSTHTWRWPEVNEWLRSMGKRHDDDVLYLSEQDETFVDYQLATKCQAARTSGWTTVDVRKVDLMQTSRANLTAADVHGSSKLDVWVELHASGTMTWSRDLRLAEDRAEVVQ